ncbi:MAG TPA: phosphoribosylamine--glycine ligase [Methanoregulaceae archaeon]|nr:phosphoribosylamine--glycine ligase [Methanoregulaceae archaeon]
MKYLVVGGGGREHAIAAALAGGGDARIAAVMATRNPGIAALADSILLAKETDVGHVVGFAAEQSVDLALIGPEAPLEAGLVDALEEAGIPAFGPTRAAARIETDKAYARDLMARHRIPGSPAYWRFSDSEEAVRFIRDHPGDLAIKPVGLTGGKGVRVMGEQIDRDGACAYARELGTEIVVEERLEGEEFTLQAFVDGSRLVPMPLVQDHKRAFEGDRGPNTGGMGSYSMPDHGLPFVTPEDRDRALGIMESVVRAMASEGTPFVGVLYGQFMNTGRGPMVIEFNARFGDPEAMNVLTLLGSNLGELAFRCVDGTLGAADASFLPAATVCKYLVPEGYPDAPGPSEPIETGDPGTARLFFANVEELDGRLWTRRSRTLAFVGTGPTLEEAEAIAERAAAGVRGPVRYRRDIGTRDLLEHRCAHMRSIR